MADDNLNVGLVKSTPFLFPANKRAGTVSPIMLHALEDFHFNTPRISRVDGLSVPVQKVTPTTTEDLCRKALGVVLSILKLNPAIQKNRATLTVVDGTPYTTPMETGWGTDICYINLFWNGSQNPVIAVMMGHRRWVKNHTHYHLEDEAKRFAVMFEYDMTTGGYGIVAKIRKAIVNSTNFHQLQDFGTVVRKAILENCIHEMEYPVAAAVYHHDKVWYADRPARHSHIVHSKEYHDARDMSGVDEYVQGFITNHGNFVTRYRAMYLAISWKTVISENSIMATVTSSTSKQYKEIERGMGGILQEEDTLTGMGYRIVLTPLFSEDLW